MIKVGEYIRTPWGEIGKITDIPKHNKYFDDGFSINGKFHTCGRLAMKELESTPNIIDLIEEGDYVNGYPVDKVYQCTNKELGKIIRFAVENATGYEMEAEELCVGLGDKIQSIVTREMFESMEYKVGE